MLMPVLVVVFGPLHAVPIMATEAAGSLAVYLTKVAVFRNFGALPIDSVVKGLVIGSSLMAGSFLAKGFVLRLPPERFRLLMDALLLLSGLAMLWAAGK